MYTRKSLLNFKFSLTQSKSRFRTFFLTKCRRKTKSRFEEKLSPGVLDLVNFFREIIFRFSKRCSEAREQYFETFRFAPRKISRWKNLFDFQRLKFLYQLVNLVLETCFIFSKTLKLSKTFSSWVSRLVRYSNNERYDSPIPDFWNKMFKKMLILECLGCFTKSIVVSILDFFWHISSRKMFELLTCKKKS